MVEAFKTNVQKKAKAKCCFLRLAPAPERFVAGALQAFAVVRDLGGVHQNRFESLPNKSFANN
jgi:hypothetical protein